MPPRPQVGLQIRNGLTGLFIHEVVLQERRPAGNGLGWLECQLETCAVHQLGEGSIRFERRAYETTVIPSGVGRGQGSVDDLRSSIDWEEIAIELITPGFRQ